jgi:predicted Zn-dependent protease
MLQGQATYSYNGQEQPAEVQVHPSRLAILIRDHYGDVRTIYWYYDQVFLQGTALAYPGLPAQQLRPLTSELFTAIESKMQKQKRSVTNKKGLTLVKVLLVLLMLGLLFYFFAVPWIGGKLAARIPVDYEKSLGNGMYNSMKGGFQVDDSRTVYINEFFRQLKFPSKYDIKVTVVKSDVSNAFAIPGGHIVVYDRLLNGLTSYEELAALLSHEAIHIEHRHTLRNLCRELSSKLFFSLLFESMEGAGSVLLANADQLKSLSYSRSLETEADEEGARLLAERGMDCNGFIRLFGVFKKEMSTGTQTPEFINSHPNLDKRIGHIQQLDYCRRPASSDTTLQHIFLKMQTAP